jgi:hypothetical protein
MKIPKPADANSYRKIPIPKNLYSNREIPVPLSVNRSIKNANPNLLIDEVVSTADRLYKNYGSCGYRCNHPSGSCNDDYRFKRSCWNCIVGQKAPWDNDERGDCIGCCLE